MTAPQHAGQPQLYHIKQYTSDVPQTRCCMIAAQHAGQPFFSIAVITQLTQAKNPHKTNLDLRILLCQQSTARPQIYTRPNYSSKPALQPQPESKHRTLPTPNCSSRLPQPECANSQRPPNHNFSQEPSIPSNQCAHCCTKHKVLNPSPVKCCLKNHTKEDKLLANYPPHLL
jgi:hypothetical protein